MSVKLYIFSYPLVLTYVLGAQENRLIETVLLSTHNICFGWEIRKLNFWYALLTKGLTDDQSYGYECLRSDFFFYLLIYKPSCCKFQESRKEKENLKLFYPPTLNNILFRWWLGSVRVTLLKVIVLYRFLGKWWNI